MSDIDNVVSDASLFPIRELVQKLGIPTEGGEAMTRSWPRKRVNTFRRKPPDSAGLSNPCGLSGGQ